MTWTELQGRLRATLRLLGDRCVLIVAAPAEAGGGYVQFLGLGAALEAEASGPEFVDGPARHTADDPIMLAAGWAAPSGPQPNWTYRLVQPALSGDMAALAQRCVVALRDVLHVPDPGLLGYRAWREPESQPTGVTWSVEQVAALDQGENPLPLPSLGLPHAA